MIWSIELSSNIICSRSSPISTLTVRLSIPTSIELKSWHSYSWKTEEGFESRLKATLTEWKITVLAAAAACSTCRVPERWFLPLHEVAQSLAESSYPSIPWSTVITTMEEFLKDIRILWSCDVIWCAETRYFVFRRMPPAQQAAC